MSHVLTLEPKGSYLVVTVTGDNTPEDVTEYLSEVREVCLKHQFARVLIVENLQGPSLRTFSIHDIVTRSSQAVWPEIHRIAYVDLNQEHNVGAMRFAETVAVNRGVNVRVFSNVSDAAKWLEEQIQDKPAS